MIPTLIQLLDRWARNLLPLATTLLLLLLVSTLPVTLPAYGTIAPKLMTAAVFYWTIHRPDLLPATVIFLIGLFEDILSGSPLGFNSLALLTMHSLALPQRQAFIDKPFVIFWLGFLVVGGAATLMRWLAISALGGRLISPLPAVLQFLMTLIVFPMLAWFLYRTHHFLPAQRSPFVEPEK